MILLFYYLFIYFQYRHLFNKKNTPVFSPGAAQHVYKKVKEIDLSRNLSSPGLNTDNQKTRG